jgi:hypothetical protein
VATGLAWVTYEYVEKPFRFGKHAAAKVLVLVVGMLLVGALGYYTLRHKGLEQREWTLAAARANAQFVGASWKYATNDTCLAQYPFAEAPKLEWWFCMKSSESPPTLLLLGTSLANQSYPGIIQNQNLQHHSVLSIGTCDPALDTNPSEGGPCFGERQVRQRRFIDGIVERSPSIRFVLVDGVKRQADSRYIDLLRARLDFLQQNGRKVIVFVPPLAPRFEPKACFSRPFKAAKDCSFPSSNRERLQREFEPLRQAIATSNPAVLFFDPNEIYCENGSCSYIKDGMPLYRDPNHLSEFGSALLFKHFVGWARVHAPGILGEN